MERENEHQSVVVGCFVDPENARLAIRRLREAGFADSDIGLITHDRNGEVEVTTLDEARGSRAGTGAAIGAAAGAGGAALWALGVAAGVLPAIGPVIAGGLLAAVLASAAGGAAAGGIVGALIGLGIPDEQARYYEDEFKRGSTIVIVSTDERPADALEILRACDSYNRYDEEIEAEREHLERADTAPLYP